MAVSVDQFGKSLVASGLMTAEEVKASWNAIPAEGRPKDGDGFAQALIDSQKLTPFQAAELLAGRGARLIMGDYTIVSQIGAGGMGQVYKAQHRRMKRTVALKVMSNAAMQDEAAVKRFQREVHAAAKLEHPNIVTAYDSGEAGSVKYLVMQFVDGGDLSDLVKKNGRLGIDQAVGYVIQAAKGLAFAHGEGVIHRDIKPANLLLDKKGVVKILDMGLARFEDGGDGLTATEQVMGTVDYMSPEQAANTKGCDGRADIYSLGCTLWYLLTGKKLYEADTLIARLMLHRDGPLPSLVKERDDAPWPLEQALHKMIAKRAADRFQSMDEVVAALAPFGSGDGSSSGMGSGIGLGTSTANAEMASFLKSVGPVTGPSMMTAPSKTNVAVDATAQFTAATADTDPKSQLLPPSKKAAQPQAKGSGRKPPPKNKTLIMSGAGGAALLVLLGVWFIFRDKDGNEIARVQLSEGGSVTVQQPVATAGPAPVAAPTRPAVSFFLPNSTPASPSGMTTPPSVAPSPTVPSSNGVVYLDDLPETEWKVGQLKLGKHNLNPFGRPYTWRGKEPAHALMTHPLKDQTAYVSYHIAGRYETFSFVTGIADTSQDGSRNPVLFRVLGDGRELWKSPPLQKVTDEANASISVRDVQELRLEVSCGNNSYHAHAVWLEPRLTPVASPVFPAEALTFGGHRYLLVDSAPGKRLSWNEAKAKSEALGGHLATINTREEFDWLLKSFRNVPSADDKERGTYRLWLGGSTDAQNPNQWKWVTGEPFDRSLWPGSGPDGAKLATAMGLSWYGVQWDDAPPGVVAQYFLVEWDAPGPAIASAATPAGPASLPTLPPPAVFPFDAATALKHQEAWAAYLGVPIEFTNGVGMEFRLIPPGEFLMGLGPEFTDEELRRLTFTQDDRRINRFKEARPAHPVRITQPFYMEVEEVSVGRYRDVVGQLRAEMDQDPNAVLTHWVTWTDAIAFCNRLSEREGKRPAYRIEGAQITPIDDADGYRLPTEAQWEYACRAGTNTLWYFGNDGGRGGIIEFRERYASPNPFGLTGLYGGANEWCWDATDLKPYLAATPSPRDDPREDVGTSRIKRGGSGDDGGGGDRAVVNSFVRSNGPASEPSKYSGFGRVVLPIVLPAKPPLPSEPRASVSGPAANPAAVPISPGDSPGAKTTNAAPRWPLAPSKPEDIKRLLELNAEVTVRTPSPFGSASVDSKLKPGDAPSTRPATIVGVLLKGNPVPTDDALLGVVAGLTDLEDLNFGNGTHSVTPAGLLKLASLVNLRRLAFAPVGNRADGLTDLLKSWPHLEYLHFPSAPKTSDEWAAAAAARPSIVELSAHRSQLSDAGLAHLEKMPQLKNLSLFDNPLTQGAIDRFAAAVPGCRIVVSGPQNNAKTIEPRTPPAAPPAPAPDNLGGVKTIPTEALTFNGHRYLLVDSPGNWERAKSQAEAAGGHLVTINSKEERDWVEKIVAPLVNGGTIGAQDRAMIGGLRNSADKPWTWVTAYRLFESANRLLARTTAFQVRRDGITSFARQLSEQEIGKFAG